MRSRQSPIVRAGSGDSHEARLAVLEQRFSEETQARCSWCNRVASARQGNWVEILISSPGTGIRPAHVFHCRDCEQAPAGAAGPGILAVPSGTRRPGAWGPPEPPVLPEPELQTASGRAAAEAKKKEAKKKGGASVKAQQPPRKQKAAAAASKTKRRREKTQAGPAHGSALQGA